MKNVGRTFKFVIKSAFIRKINLLKCCESEWFRLYAFESIDRYLHKHLIINFPSLSCCYFPFARKTTRRPLHVYVVVELDCWTGGETLQRRVPLCLYSFQTYCSVSKHKRDRHSLTATNCSSDSVQTDPLPMAIIPCGQWCDVYVFPVKTRQRNYCEEKQRPKKIIIISGSR